MDGRISMYVVLLCVWCSLDTDRFLMVVTAKPTVSVMILTPVADRKEGGQVEMKCTATNLESYHVVEWTTENYTLRWDETTLTTNPRFTFKTETGPKTTVQDFTITDLQVEDHDEYICNVNEPSTLTGRVSIVATTRVILSVMHFPSDASTPIASHDPWIVAFEIAIVLFVAFFIITIILIFRVIKVERRNERLNERLSETNPRVPNAEPYMELQPTDGKRRVYMDPTTQDTYYQPVELENESPEHDYARSEDNTNTSYEVVKVPPTGDIKNQDTDN